MADMPSRVAAAQEFLENIWGAEGRGKYSTFDNDTERVHLDKRECAAKEAALDVMTLYFRGEMDFGDRPMHASKRKKRKTAKAPSDTAPQDSEAK